jgi:hypothetical protein
MATICIKFYACHQHSNRYNFPTCQTSATIIPLNFRQNNYFNFTMANPGHVLHNKNHSRFSSTQQLPYFPAYSVHLTYNLHPKLFCIPFEIDNTHLMYNTLIFCDIVYVLVHRSSNDLWSTGELYLDFFLCPLALKDNLGGLHHSLVTNCLKGRCTFFVFNL